MAIDLCASNLYNITSRDSILGVALSMLLSFRLSAHLTAYVLALALVAVSGQDAFAQVPSTTSVETYVGQITPSAPPEGIIPEGMTWNKPLKAGDMVLPRLTKPEEKAIKPRTPPILQPSMGDLKAPQLLTNQATAPKLTNDNKSAASLMLLQGMKSALQKSGQNPDLPKSELVPADSSQETAVGEPLKLPALQPAIAPKANDSGYVEGQEPKGWAAPTSPSDKASSAPLAKGAVVPSESDGMMDIVFPPEMTTSSPAAAISTPKATDLPEEPASLEAAPVTKAAPTKGEETGFFDRLASPFTSIFGEPVKDGAEEEGKKPASSGSAKACEPKIEKWTRACTDAGYPAHFVGEIVGETRMDCVSPEPKDVWLSNTCAAPIGSSPVAVQSKARGTLEQSVVDSESTKAALSSSSVIVPDQSTGAVDGACGVANGLAADSKPADDLCSKGQATAVSGEGPWRWSCTGLRGGMTVSCAAPVSAMPTKKAAKDVTPGAPVETRVEDGKCGDAVQGGYEIAPTTGLCLKGTASRVNGDGPWTWACSGLNGGAAAACTANKKIDGACGLASNAGTDSMPMRDLCTAGYASAVTGNGPWNWSCSGLHGGAAATCTASAKVNAVCGPASMKGYNAAPQDGLCSVGTASSVSGDGPWSWTCQGDLGGASVSCQASVLSDGVCGTAHGNRFVQAPKEGLCSQGVATRVSGLGPWNWNCSGSNGGSTATCTAALASQEEIAEGVKCGKASEVLAFAEPKDDLCASGKASDVSGEGPWTWTCRDEAGHQSSCSTLTASGGLCGKAADTPSKDAPTRNLCEKGAPSDVTMFEKTSWKWECQGAMGSSSATCTAPLTRGAKTEEASAQKVAEAKVEAQCGSAAGQSFTEIPDSNLCEIGKASTVRGHGPWTWSCGTKSKVYCEAQKTVEGRCGVTNGSIQKSIPTSGLCATGAATEVTGNGPWMWSCVGSGGGGSSSCSAASFAQTRVDGVCGAASNSVMMETPKANLCDSGAPSTVYGEGPWTWTCSGMNGGIASTCSTSKVVPKAPPPPGPAVNGLCGSSNGVAADSAPDEETLCTSGTATSISGQGPWNWGCIGANGGMTVSCTAPLTPPAPIVGACGGASGVPTLTMPKSGLCSAGISSAVSGKGPWTWSCSGTNGGGAVSCVAPLAGSAAAASGLPSMVTPSLDSGDAPSPRAAPVGLVTPQLPSGPLPALKPGELPQLKSAKKAVSSLKETKSAKAIASEPDSALDPIEGAEGIKLPSLGDTMKPPAGVVPPVKDSQGNPVPGARLVLDPDLTTISFERASDQLDKEAVKIVERVTGIMLANPATRITLVAYSDTGGQISAREARRLSLNRALVVRDFMTAKGVPSSRVDVRPMGANVPSGDMDRVDIKVN